MAATEVVPEARLKELMTECNEIVSILTVIVRNAAHNRNASENRK